jgi:hypothetical protein
MCVRLVLSRCFLCDSCQLMSLCMGVQVECHTCSGKAIRFSRRWLFLLESMPSPTVACIVTVECRLCAVEQTLLCCVFWAQIDSVDCFYFDAYVLIIRTPCKRSIHWTPIQFSLKRPIVTLHWRQHSKNFVFPPSLKLKFYIWIGVHAKLKS